MIQTGFMQECGLTRAWTLNSLTIIIKIYEEGVIEDVSIIKTVTLICDLKLGKICIYFIILSL